MGIKALVEIAKLFKVPTILASSRDDGPNGPVLQYLLD
jgi:hypothetical protein